MSIFDRRKFLLLMMVASYAGLLESPVLAEDGGKGGGGGGKGGGGGRDDDDDKGGGADDGDDDDDRHEARDAVKGGKAASLRDIVKTIRQKYQGDVVDVKISKSGANLRYSIRMLGDDGRVFVITVDATTQKILRVSGS